MKQGFLITAYKDFEALYELTSYLTEGGDKVFIHVDQNSKEIRENELKQLNKITNCEAISSFAIPWGGMNHVLAILELLSLAAADKEVSYIHCITGQDYPVISIVDMEERFLHCKNIYMDCIAPENHTKQVIVRYRYYNWFCNKNVKNPFLWQLQNATIFLQKILGIRRKRIGEFNQIYKGLIYVSMPNDAAEFVIDYCESHPKYLKDLSKCQIPEEFFFQTLFMNSEYSNNVVDKNLRYMDWSQGDGSSPAYLDFNAFQSIEAGDYIFARKLDSKISKELKEEIIRKRF